VSPPWRSNLGMAYDSARQVAVMFGGQPPSTGYINDTWEWNSTNWVQRKPVISPSPRWGHGLVYDSARKVAVLFGGFNNDANNFIARRPNAATWERNGADWAVRTPPVSPPARALHGMAYDSTRGVVVLYGGESVYNSVNLADTWEWDGSTWTQRSIGDPH